MTSTRLRLALSLAAALGLCTHAAAAQSAPRATAQVVAGTLAVPIGFAAGYVVGSGFRPHGSSNSGVAVGFTGALLGPALAVRAIGAKPTGKLGTTVLGTAAGYGASVALVPLAFKIANPRLKIAAIAAALMLPGIGATVAYNASRP